MRWAQLLGLSSNEVRPVDFEEFEGIGSCHLKVTAGCRFSVSSLAWLLAVHSCRDFTRPNTARGPVKSPEG